MRPVDVTNSGDAKSRHFLVWLLAGASLAVVLLAEYGVLTDSVMQVRLPELRQGATTRMEFLDELVALRKSDGFDAAQQFIIANRGQREAAIFMGCFSDLSALAAVSAFSLLMWWNLASRTTEAALSEQAERVLRNSEARKTAMFEAALDCIISIDHKGAILEFNAAAERTFGQRREDVLGRELAAVIIPPAYREAHRNGLIRYLATGEGPVLNQRLELSALRADGTEFPVELTVIRIPVDGPVIFTAFLRDITERKRLEDELRKSAVELSEADRRKDEFLAMLAHELRNPLAPISHAVRIVKLSQGDDEAVQSAADIMERQISQMRRLVDDLLDVSRISRGKIELRRERVELTLIIEQAIETSRPMIDAAGHELTVSLPAQPIYLHADTVRLVQVFGNILNNSCKYSEPGGRISLTAERQGSDVLVSVRDAGLGIPAAMLPKIFEMFTQVDRSLERSQGGLGIGLSLVKNLVQLHGGSVEALSDGAGQGSTFIVRLPVLIEPSNTVRPAPPRLAAGEPAVTKGRRILVVDDNRDSAETLALLLKITGSETRIAYDGVQAVEAAADFRPDVILLDIGLPKLSGYEVARKIRDQPWGAPIVIVALTGWGQDEDRQKSKEAGFNGHMVKPVDYSALLKLLAELLRLPV